MLLVFIGKDHLWYKEKILHECSVLLNLLKELGKKDKVRGSAYHRIGFPNKFNKFSDTGARLQDSVYHMTLKSHFISKFCTKMSRFRH